MNAATPAIVLGGTGYVAGELLRLIAAHPQLEVAAILSDSQPGAPVAEAFAHLRSAYPDLKFAAPEELHAVLRREPLAALFSAAPHGVSAAIVDRLLATAAAAGTRVHCVDISADFRFASQSAYEAVYKHAHGAPARIRARSSALGCALPAFGFLPLIPWKPYGYFWFPQWKIANRAGSNPLTKRSLASSWVQELSLHTYAIRHSIR